MVWDIPGWDHTDPIRHTDGHCAPAISGLGHAQQSHTGTPNRMDRHSTHFPSGRFGPRGLSMNTNTPLWDVLGRPPLNQHVPTRRMPAWRTARRLLAAALGTCGSLTVPRSWQQIWRTCRQSQPPPATTWEALCRDLTIAPLAAKSSAEQSIPGAILWNLRWMRDPHSEIATRKRGTRSTSAALRRWEINGSSRDPLGLNSCTYLASSLPRRLFALWPSQSRPTRRTPRGRSSYYP